MATFFAPRGVIANPDDWAPMAFNVTAGETFKPGDFVIFDAAGTISIAAAASNDVGNVLIVGIARGFATEALANSRECPVDVPKPGAMALMLLPLYHSAAASAVLAQTGMDLPTTFPLRNQAGQWCANVENNGTNDRVTARQRDLKYPYSEPAGWFWFSPTVSGWWGVGGAVS